jgi:tetratricopeptide (TPR) repeat protein
MAFAAIYLGWSLLEPVRLGVEAPSGDWSEAESAFAEATELFDSSFSPSIGIRTRGQWAYLRLLQGRLAGAQRLLAEANEAAAELVTPPATEGHRLWLAAEVATALGNWPEAMSLFEEACEAIVQSDEHWWTARVRLSWAQAHLTRAQPGDRQRAAELYRAAHDAFQNMGAEGYAEFHRGYLAEVDREGLIVDLRYNSGGHVSSLLLEKLARRRIGYDLTRWGVPIPYPLESVMGPMVALTNEQAGSDGDIFSHGFKLMGLGPLLGKRTWGGVVGIWPRQALVDGSLTTQPEYSFWFSDVGWGVENYGTDPDIEVDNTPQDYAQGVDAQLKRSIAEIQKLLESSPPKMPDFANRPSRALPSLPANPGD